MEPKLAPPGAGLPWVELMIARALFRWRTATVDQAGFSARFQAEREKIRALIPGCDDGQLARRVLIARPRGLEDSSRYWSVWMTLDHLRIVHGGISRIIETLAQGKIPGGVSSTAAVKPNPNVTPGVIGDYEASCDNVAKAAAGAGNLRTKVRFAHPWFGPLDAFGWHALSAGHMGIHRTQIERILAKIS